MNRALLLEAVAELRRRTLRTGLTLLGMIFGVGAIVAMLAVGEGSKREALRLVAELGLNNVLVESKGIDAERLKEVRLRSLGLSAADAAAVLSVVPGARSVALKKEIKVDQLISGTQVIGTRAFAVSPAYAEHGGLTLKAGRWLAPCRRRHPGPRLRARRAPGAHDLRHGASTGTARQAEPCVAAGDRRAGRPGAEQGRVRRGQARSR
jgi:putative ABC transport system permease protein